MRKTFTMPALFVLAVTFVASRDLRAGAPAAATALEKKTGRMGKEGSPALRDAYFGARRRGPGANFNAARARLRGVAEHVRNLARSRPAPLAMGTTWTPIGPTPITGGQTTPRSSVTGRATAIAFAGSTVFVGGAQGGVFRSDDSGATWTEVPGPAGGFASLAVGSLAVDPQNSSTIYIGTGEANFSNDCYYGVGVYKSVDGGTTWTGPYTTEVGTGNDVFTGAGINSIVVDRGNSSNVIACTSPGARGIGSVTYPNPPGIPRTGVYRSTDGGVTWTNAPDGSFFCSNVVQDPKAASWWFAAMAQDPNTTQGSNTLNGGLLLSTDGGASWIQLAGNPTPPPAWTVTNPLPANSGVANQGWGRAWVTAGAASGDSESTVYVGMGMANVADTSANPPPSPVGPAGTGLGRIYKSTDSGKNWAFLGATAGYCNPQCDYDLPVYAVPTDPTKVFHGGAGNDTTNLAANPPFVAMFRGSSNGGTSWVDMTGLHADQHFIAAEPGSTTNIWAANDGGVWRTTGGVGGSWTNVNNPSLSLTQFQKIALHPTDSSVVYGGTQDNGTDSWNGTDAWLHSDDGDGGYPAISQFDPTKVAHTYFNTTNEQIGPTFAAGLGSQSLPAAYAGGVFGYCKKCGVGGLDRTNGIPATDAVLFYAPMVMDPGSGAAGNTLYFGTQRLYRSHDFFNKAASAMTVNNFLVFTDISGKDLAGTNGALSAIAPVANSASPGSDAQLIFVGSSIGDFWRTTDGGTNWLPFGSFSLYISDIAVDPTTTASLASTVVYVAESGFEAVAGRNVKKSVNGGAVWTDSGSGLPNVPVNALLVDPVNHNRVWAGTDLGVYLSQDAGGTWNPYTNGMPPNIAVFDLKASPGSPGGDQIVAATHGRGAFRLGPLTPVRLERFTAD